MEQVTSGGQQRAPSLLKVRWNRSGVLTFPASVARSRQPGNDGLSTPFAASLNRKISQRFQPVLASATPRSDVDFRFSYSVSLFTLHACSDKKYFHENLPFSPRRFHTSPCNVTQCPSIFPKNSSLCSAVNVRIDRIMQKLNALIQTAARHTRPRLSDRRTMVFERAVALPRIATGGAQ